MEKLISLCKRRGFVFPSSDPYGGIGGFYDFGPLGVELRNNIKRAWWRRVVQERDDVVGLESSQIMHPNVWEASGHIAHFSDPLVDCRRCKARFRADDVPVVPGKPITCPQCGSEDLTDARPFQMMFKTFVGPAEDTAATAYLRPETAQGMFVDFPIIQGTARKKLPFGIAQIGKAFRNEITPGQLLFRLREFEQMEIEYFVRPGDAPRAFEEWLSFMRSWLRVCGIAEEHVVFHEIPDGERAFYSSRTVDIEYQYPFGQKELYGIANRGSYDLERHAATSKQDFTYYDQEANERFLPHVIEPTFGLDRTMLVVLLEAYHEIAGGRTTTTESNKEVEVVLRLPAELAPIKVAVLPLSKKEPLAAKAQEIAATLRKQWMVAYDDVASIGRRYRRQDEIGTPYCVTIDFASLEDQCVTVRYRDSMAQERIAIAALSEYLRARIPS
ncbi:glycine--tRNA ligase [Candidatus Uhrbacteria bacterium]|nr:glycine--tRNA ligase [Candidatus Uhrbacteria bacterium]